MRKYVVMFRESRSYDDIKLGISGQKPLPIYSDEIEANSVKDLLLKIDSGRYTFMPTNGDKPFKIVRSNITMIYQQISEGRIKEFVIDNLDIVPKGLIGGVKNLVLSKIANVVDWDDTYKKMIESEKR
jgi:hypothetical protein